MAHLYYNVIQRNFGPEQQNRPKFALHVGYFNYYQHPVSFETNNCGALLLGLARLYMIPLLTPFSRSVL